MGYYGFSSLKSPVSSNSQFLRICFIQVYRFIGIKLITPFFVVLPIFSVHVSPFVLSYSVHGASQVALVVKNPPTNAGGIRDTGSVLGSGRPLEEGHGSPLQYSCLENPMDRGAWQATVHRVTKSRTGLNYLACAVPEAGRLRPGSRHAWPW